MAITILRGESIRVDDGYRQFRIMIVAVSSTQISQQLISTLDRVATPPQ